MAEQGKPYALPKGRQIVRTVQCAEGRGCWKKRMSLCSAEDKGSRSALMSVLGGMGGGFGSGGLSFSQAVTLSGETVTVLAVSEGALALGAEITVTGIAAGTLIIASAGINSNSAQSNLEKNQEKVDQAKGKAKTKIESGDTTPGGRTVYIERQTYGYDVVIMDKNGKSIISVVGGNAKNGVANTLKDMDAVRKMLMNQGGYSTIPMYQEGEMPIIKNYSDKPTIELELNLHSGKGFVYEKNQNDYLNWIPYKLKLIAGKDNYELDNMAFSLEGLKCFLGKMQAIIKERNESTKYEIISYCGPENEFEILFQNTDDYFEDLIIHTEVWMNAAYLPIPQSGFSVGYKFNIKFKDLEKFAEDLKKQLQRLLKI